MNSHSRPYRSPGVLDRVRATSARHLLFAALPNEPACAGRTTLGSPARPNGGAATDGRTARSPAGDREPAPGGAAPIVIVTTDPHAIP